MIRGIVTILTMAGLSSVAAGINQTASVTLSWAPSLSPNIAGYDIYYGTASSNYTSSITVSNVTGVTIQGLTNGATYYFAARTFSSSGGLSAFSPQISYTAGTTSAIPGAIASQLASPAGQFSFSVSGTSGFEYAVEASTNLVNWVVLGTNTAPFKFVDPAAGQFGHRFYRAVYAPDVIYTFPPMAGLLVSNFVNTSGQFSFTVMGTPSDPYAVEASTNLVNWTILATNNAPFIFIDTNASQFSHRFYRAVPAADAGLTATAATTTPAAGLLTSTTANASGQFSFTVTGTVGYPYAIEASTNLVNWIILATNNAPFNFIDTNVSQFSHRYFRAVPAPYAGMTATTATTALSPVPTITSASVNTAGRFGFTVSGITGYQYVVEASTNLVNWTVLETNAAPFSFVDINVANYSQRFYRAVYIPN
jgi:hypothetical protein